jgi:hypothetical protein
MRAALGRSPILPGCVQDTLDLEFKEKFSVVRATMVSGYHTCANLGITHGFGASTTIEFLIAFFRRESM